MTKRRGSEDWRGFRGSAIPDLTFPVHSAKQNEAFHAFGRLAQADVRGDQEPRPHRRKCAVPDRRSHPSSVGAD